jgi:hypothetical protein
MKLAHQASHEPIGSTGHRSGLRRCSIPPIGTTHTAKHRRWVTKGAGGASRACSATAASDGSHAARATKNCCALFCSLSSLALFVSLASPSLFVSLSSLSLCCARYAVRAGAADGGALSRSAAPRVARLQFFIQGWEAFVVPAGALPVQVSTIEACL